MILKRGSKSDIQSSFNPKLDKFKVPGRVRTSLTIVKILILAKKMARKCTKII